jgi:hypothetical protein
MRFVLGAWAPTGCFVSPWATFRGGHRWLWVHWGPHFVGFGRMGHVDLILARRFSGSWVGEWGRTPFALSEGRQPPTESSFSGVRRTLDCGSLLPLYRGSLLPSTSPDYLRPTTLPRRRSRSATKINPLAYTPAGWLDRAAAGFRIPRCFARLQTVA